MYLYSALSNHGPMVVRKQAEYIRDFQVAQNQFGDYPGSVSAGMIQAWAKIPRNMVIRYSYTNPEIDRVLDLPGVSLPNMILSADPNACSQYIKCQAYNYITESNASLDEWYEWHAIVSTSFEMEDDGEEFEYRPEYMRAWDLPNELNLTTIAADFYLLYNLNLDDCTQGDKLVEFCNRYAPIFSRYTDMVVGGEIRHADDHVNRDGLPRSCEPLAEEIWAGDGWASGRARAWETWHDFRRTYGTDALVWAARIFRRFRSGGYGGSKWANIAEILAYYELGKLSSKMFMDFVWGLEHNGGSYFDKLNWNREQLRQVLDINLHGNVMDLMGLASKEVKEAYRGR